MNTRKVILLTVPVIIVVLIVLGALLTFIFNVSTPATTDVPAEQAVQEQTAPVAPTEAEAAAPTATEPAVSGKPTVTYENQE